MISVTYPQFSFVRFFSSFNTTNSWYESAQPGKELLWLLPLGHSSDAAFSVIVSASTTPEQDFLCNLNMKTQAKLYLSLGITDQIVDHNPANVGTLPKYWPDATNVAALEYIERIRLDTSNFLFIWRHNLWDITTFLEPGQCFQFLLFLSNGSTSVMATSNPFTRVYDDYNNTTLLTYRSDLDDYGFHYCAHLGYYNRVRLPMYPHKSKYNVDQSVYVRSSGIRDVTRSIITKFNNWETDYLPEWAHDCLLMALQHDFNSVNHSDYMGQIRLDGDYDNEFIDVQGYPLYPAKFKAFRTPAVYKKNMCGECESIIAASLIMEKVFDRCTVYTWALPLAAAGCVAPVTYWLVNWNAAYMNTAPIIDNAAGTIEVHIKLSVPSGSGWLVQFGMGMQGVIEQYVQINGTYSGISGC